jgi:hypothetical protein
VRRIQVQPDDLSGFLFELRVIAGHVTVQSMRLQVCFTPHVPDQVFAHAQDSRHLAQRPMPGIIRWWLLRLGQYLAGAVVPKLSLIFAIAGIRVATLAGRFRRKCACGSPR